MGMQLHPVALLWDIEIGVRVQGHFAKRLPERLPIIRAERGEALVRGSSLRAGSVLDLYICGAGLGICGGRVRASAGSFGGAICCLARPEIGSDVIRERGEALVGPLPLLLAPPLLHKAVNCDAKESYARVHRER